MNHDHFIAPPGNKILLKDYDPGFTAPYKNKTEAYAKLGKDIERLAKYQDVDRVNTPEKNWKVSVVDARERAHWDEYMVAFEETLSHTSTEQAPRYIIPADNKWFTRTGVADVIIQKLKALNLRYPAMNEEHEQQLVEIKELLKTEPSKDNG